MAKLVFDIETSALPLESFDDAQQEYLFRDAKKLPDEAQRAVRQQELLQLFNLWPLTARVVCIAMLNADTARGQVLFIAEDFEEDAAADTKHVKFIACPDEAELLTAFWDVARHYDGIVTFNGRGYRYQSEPHCDLADQLTFYSSGRDGAGRRFNLDFYCKAFGIQSPKSHGVTGADINRLLAEGRSREIAEYCLRDVQATVLLYH